MDADNRVLHVSALVSREMKLCLAQRINHTCILHHSRNGASAACFGGKKGRQRAQAHSAAAEECVHS